MKELVDRIMDRCIDDGGCLVWQQRGHERCPALHVGQGYVYARRIMYEYKHGPIPEGMCVTFSCECKWCMKHLVAVTRAELNRLVSKRGAWKGLTRNAKIAATKQQRSTLLDAQKVLDIRYGGGTLREAAARNGISKASAARIRSGKSWRDYSNPFAQLMVNA